MTRRERVKRIWQGSGRKWRTARPRLAKWAGTPKERTRRLRRWLEIRDWCAAKAQAHHERGERRKARRWRRRRRWAGKRVDQFRTAINRAKYPDIPSWLPAKHARQWHEPWTVPADPSKAKRFKALLWRHGYLSPHFTRHAARSRDSTRGNYRDQAIPGHLRHNAQRHAFKLERVRHRLGDKPMHPGSWFRSGTPGVDDGHNYRVGGARWSEHKLAHATDWFDSERARLGGAAFDEAMHAEFADGGRGVVGNTRQIRHADDGDQRTWSY